MKLAKSLKKLIRGRCLPNTSRSLENENPMQIVSLCVKISVNTLSRLLELARATRSMRYALV
jgi:hypothetical protein